MLEQVDRQHPAADGAGRGARESVDLRRQRAVARLAAAGGVRDPVGRLAIDRADRLIADYETADIARGLVDVLLDIEDGVLVGTERVLVLEQGFGGVSLRDLRPHAPP